MTTKEFQPVSREELEQVREVLGTLISWMAQSTGSPIGIAEATKLLNKLNAK